MSVATKNSLVRDLQKLGLSAGDWVATHSSMKAIGGVEGGPQAVIEALIESVSPGGMVMMPLFVRITQGQTFIDLNTTPAYTGLLTETFRSYPGVVRSPFPTHSVGIYGPRAREIAETHRHSTAIGRGGPFHLLAENGGWVLHIGTNFNSSSILHLAEVLAQVPYLDLGYPGYEVTLQARDTDGNLVTVEPKEIPGDSSKFYLVQEEMERRNLLRHGLIGQAPSVMARAADMLEVAVPMMRQDPERFLCDNPSCALCPRARKLVREWKAKNKSA